MYGYKDIDLVFNYFWRGRGFFNFVMLWRGDRSRFDVNFSHWELFEIVFRHYRVKLTLQKQNENTIAPTAGNEKCTMTTLLFYAQWKNLLYLFEYMMHALHDVFMRTIILITVRRTRVRTYFIYRYYNTFHILLYRWLTDADNVIDE